MRTITVYFDNNGVITHEIGKAKTFAKRVVDPNKKDRFGDPVIVSEQYGFVKSDITGEAKSDSIHT